MDYISEYYVNRQRGPKRYNAERKGETDIMETGKGMDARQRELVLIMLQQIRDEYLYGDSAAAHEKICQLIAAVGRGVKIDSLGVDKHV